MGHVLHILQIQGVHGALESRNFGGENLLTDGLGTVVLMQLGMILLGRWDGFQSGADFKLLEALIANAFAEPDNRSVTDADEFGQLQKCAVQNAIKIILYIQSNFALRIGGGITLILGGNAVFAAGLVHGGTSFRRRV